MKMKIVSVCGSRFGRIASIGGSWPRSSSRPPAVAPVTRRGSGLGIDNMRQGLAAVDLQSVNGTYGTGARIERAAGASGSRPARPSTTPR